jgi:hypothetical protein
MITYENEEMAISILSYSYPNIQSQKLSIEEVKELLKGKSIALSLQDNNILVLSLDSSSKNISFGEAIEELKKGKKVARRGWNGKDQYIELATCISYKNNKDEVINPNHYNIGNKAIAFVGTSGVQLGWLASQADMLAEDWYVKEENNG